MTIFAKQMTVLMVQHPWTMWLLLLVPIALTFVINFRATRNPVTSFILLMITAIIYGITFAFIAGAYTGEDISLQPLLLRQPCLSLWPSWGLLLKKT